MKPAASAWPSLVLAAALLGPATAPLAGAASEAAAAPVVLGTASHAGEPELAAAVLRLAGDLLARQGLALQEGSVRFTGTGPVATGAPVEVVWSPPAARGALRLPLRLALRGAAGQPDMQAVVYGRLQQDMPVLNRPLARGAALGCADVSVQRRPVEMARADLWPLPCSLPAGTVLRRPLNEGDVLRRSDAGARPAVAQMQPVTIRVVAGAVVLESAGLALADAEVGDTVRVRPNISRQAVDARVVGPQAVVLESGTMQ
ncbi:flagellar basal body P-ring formation chaperone FlgA [Eleftheria terrae]|uniref:flagellar basal body P-ring formation chaperone FlgA n=1 Tax=Eleftheria terrae TaxID=1597781 RepID=UPI00263B1458|nr:flagellar basal body P-ring formation chaperone FlgA [Eleftheria terrae]WKB51648.1 flagellar basal body P-ring formation chaperone FlgA [Eleftheria terrae]